MSAQVVQFGQCLPGRRYRARPGAYGLAIGPDQSILVVAVDGHLVLPGGGLEAGETPEQGLLREFREETGYRVRVLRYLGLAGQYVLGRTDGIAYNKLCRFYLVEPIGKPGPIVDLDHAARWIPTGEALGTLTEEAHRWAVAQAQET